MKYCLINAYYIGWLKIKKIFQPVYMHVHNHKGNDHVCAINLNCAAKIHNHEKKFITTSQHFAIPIYLHFTFSSLTTAIIFPKDILSQRVYQFSRNPIFTQWKKKRTRIHTLLTHDTLINRKHKFVTHYKYHSNTWKKKRKEKKSPNVKHGASKAIECPV